MKYSRTVVLVVRLDMKYSRLVLVVRLDMKYSRTVVLVVRLDMKYSRQSYS